MILDQDVWAAILTPISEHAPSGSSVRFDQRFSELREARRQEDPRLSQGIWKRDIKTADWAIVQKQAIDILVGESKDLQVFAWLIESLVAEHFMEGLSEGLSQLDSFLSRFWDTLHPLPANATDTLEEPFQSRMNVLENLGKIIEDHLIDTPITDGRLYQETSHIFIELKNAKYHQAILQRLPDNQKSSYRADGPDYMDILEKVKLTPQIFYDEQIALINHSVETLSKIKNFIDTVGVSPTWSNLQTLLGELLRYFKQFRDIAFVPTNTTIERSDEDSVLELEMPTPMNEDPQVQTIVDMAAQHQQERFKIYSQLNDLVGQLVNIEPFHPVPYLINRLIQWGIKPGDQVLIEWSKDPKTLETLLKIAGFQQNSENERA